MKNIKYSLLFLSAAATGACAQSNVTLYGLIDEGIDYTTNSHGSHAVDLQSGYAAGSRW